MNFDFLCVVVFINVITSPFVVEQCKTAMNRNLMVAKVMQLLEKHAPESKHVLSRRYLDGFFERFSVVRRRRTTSAPKLPAGQTM